MERFVERARAWGQRRALPPQAVVDVAIAALAAEIGGTGDPVGGAAARPADREDVRDFACGTRMAAAAPLELALGLAMLYESALTAVERKQRGAHYTPAAVAERLVTIALETAARDGAEVTICDPALGAGVFLVAAHGVLVARGLPAGDAARALYGADIDTEAVRVARIALQVAAGGRIAGIGTQLVVGDPLVEGLLCWPQQRNPFDIVVGNPPFLNQLRRGSVRTRADAGQLVAALGAPAKGYVDTSALFLLRSLGMVRPGGGVVALIQPQSILSAHHALALRQTVSAQADLAAFWFSREPVFAAGVRVCAPVVVSSKRSRPVRRFVDAQVSEASPCGQPDAEGDWSVLVTDLLGLPPIDAAIEAAPRLGARGCRATAGFRDEFYGLKGAVHDERAGRSGARLVTAGLIEPLRVDWGVRRVRFDRRDYSRPIVAIDAISDPRVKRWYAERQRPKIVVATQTKVIECAVDAEGAYVPLTPVIEVVADDGRLWHWAAALTSPVASALALRRSAGAGLALDVIKLSARQLLDLPVPLDAIAWDEGASCARELATAPARDATVWRDFGVVMGRAHGLGSDAADELTSWWLGRLMRSTASKAPKDGVTRRAVSGSAETGLTGPVSHV